MNRVKTVNAAFNSGVKARLKGLPITYYNGKNEWYKRHWQEGWNSLKQTKEVVEKQPIQIKNEIKKIFNGKRYLLISLILLIFLSATNVASQKITSVPIPTPQIIYNNICITSAQKTNPVVSSTYTPTQTPVQPVNKIEVISRKGFLFVLHYEGFTDRLINDGGGHCTIGYGHLVHIGECNGDPSEQPWKWGITRDDALKLYGSDVEKYEKDVVTNVTVPLNQCQFDALVSFTFNVGMGKTSPARKIFAELNKGDYDIVKNTFIQYQYSGGVPLLGLEKRRKAEINIFTTCKYE